MKKWIDNKPGIITTMIGKCVDVEIHPRFPQLYRFEYEGEKYMCSEYAFMTIDETFDGDVLNVIPLNKKGRQSGDNQRYHK